MAALEPVVALPPSDERVQDSIPLTTEKDAHVLAALECSATYLLTVDRRHLFTPVVFGAGLPLQVMTPGEFLRQTVSGESC